MTQNLHHQTHAIWNYCSSNCPLIIIRISATFTCTVCTWLIYNIDIDWYSVHIYSEVDHSLRRHPAHTPTSMVGRMANVFQNVAPLSKQRISKRRFLKKACPYGQRVPKRSAALQAANFEAPFCRKAKLRMRRFSKNSEVLQTSALENAATKSSVLQSAVTVLDILDNATTLRCFG